MTTRYPYSSAVAFLSLFAATTACADPSDDRFTLRLGAMHADGSGELYGDGSAAGVDASFREAFDLGGKEISPRIDGVFRFSDRNRLIFDYFRFKKDNNATLGRDLTYGDVTLPAGSFARYNAEFQLASLIYDFSVVDSPRFSAGLQIGAEWAKVDGRLRAEAGENQYRASAGEKGVAPVVGLRLTGKPSDKWLLSVQAQYLDAGWGNFDYEGEIKRANAIVEYRITDAFGVFAGYDWFKINYEESGRDARGGIDLEFKGPMAGITLAF
ncbi:hypothetical protein [Dokdonella koreensis]|uniref:Outer membrane protein beta-barrel domain-containing protein n=1 Tax=Dokdonella koreensis DS-123 TaxID=1300342 RepID=A0A160DVT3_9GAMM|nr:hypothetical protein [Dokdonella koreensis]ANB18261.1 Hypothetical protein I596_2249 [Dokdonella koreensis DS-123]